MGGQFCDALKEKYGFTDIDLSARDIFSQYEYGTVFFDLSFTNFWVWQDSLHYIYKQIEDTMTVVYVGVDGEAYCILLPGPSGNLKSAIEEIHGIFSAEGHITKFEYIPENWLAYYLDCGLPVMATSDRDWSDYIYCVSEFVNLEGHKNKFKRRELKQVEKLGEVTFCALTWERLPDADAVFQDWCSWHDCEQCVFGCEKRSFERLKEIWDDRYYGGIVYLNGKPIAFAVAETLGGCANYPFQKNGGRFQGLTYYLSYHCARLPGHPPTLNWCEDMGLAGLRENKLRYSPCELVEKYSVEIVSGEKKRSLIRNEDKGMAERK